MFTFGQLNYVKIMKHVKPAVALKPSVLTRWTVFLCK